MFHLFSLYNNVWYWTVTIHVVSVVQWLALVQDKILKQHLSGHLISQGFTTATNCTPYIYHHYVCLLTERHNYIYATKLDSCGTFLAGNHITLDASLVVKNYFVCCVTDLFLLESFTYVSRFADMTLWDELLRLPNASIVIPYNSAHACETLILCQWS